MQRGAGKKLVKAVKATPKKLTFVTQINNEGRGEK